MNLPIYRAKKIDSDEYVIGYCEYIPNDGRSINTINSGCWISWIKLDNKGFRDRFEVEIDPTTLSIHFPDILDSKGNKIFASLSEDGKGGDIIEYNGKKEVVKYSNGTIQTYMFRFEDLIDLNIKVIGIHE